MKKPYTNELALFSMMWNSEQSKIIRDYIHTLEDDLVNANVGVKMLQEQLAKLSIVEDIAENLLDPSDTRLADTEQTIATKDAVILAQSERIKELERELAKFQPRFKVGDICKSQNGTVKVEQVYEDTKVKFSYLVTHRGSDWKDLLDERELSLLEESETDNG